MRSRYDHGQFRFTRAKCCEVEPSLLLRLFLVTGLRDFKHPQDFRIEYLFRFNHQKFHLGAQATRLTLTGSAMIMIVRLVQVTIVSLSCFMEQIK